MSFPTELELSLQMGEPKTKTTCNETEPAAGLKTILKDSTEVKSNKKSIKLRQKQLQKARKLNLERQKIKDEVVREIEAYENLEERNAIKALAHGNHEINRLFKDKKDKKRAIKLAEKASVFGKTQLDFMTAARRLYNGDLEKAEHLSPKTSEPTDGYVTEAYEDEDGNFVKCKEQPVFGKVRWFQKLKPTPKKGKSVRFQV